MLEQFLAFFEKMAFYQMTLGNVVMLFIAGILIYVAVKKDAEPLLLIPIAFGIVLANIPRLLPVFSILHNNFPMGNLYPADSCTTSRKDLITESIRL